MSKRRKTEWVGGQLVAPFHVQDGDQRIRPVMTFWMDVDNDLVVGSSLGEDVSFAESLASAMAAPAAGPPRQPDRVRVADATLAAVVRAGWPGFDVVVAPTPEIEMLLESFMAHQAEHAPEPLYLDVEVTPTVVAAFFAATADLFTLAPWKKLYDGQVFRVDAPALGIDGGALCVIGALGESFGYLLFPSFAGYEAFASASDRRQHGDLDIGTSWLVVDFDLPAPEQHDEVRAQGWRLARPDAYPWMRHCDRDGVPRPLVDADLAVATACARALSAFMREHGKRLRKGKDLEATSEIDGVQIMLPFREIMRRSGIRGVQDRIMARLLELGRQRLGDRAAARVRTLFTEIETSAPMAVAWSYCDMDAGGGQSLTACLLAEQGETLPADERAFLVAELAGCMSIHRIEAVHRGVGVRARDLLVGGLHEVSEIIGSENMVEGMHLLARLHVQGDEAVFSGLDPRPLWGAAAAEVELTVRRHLGSNGPIDPARLRGESITTFIVRTWQEMRQLTASKKPGRKKR